jgi:hypothetical protein
MTRRAQIAALALTTLAAPASALACGGFFCDATFDPIVQTAERVLFRVNPDDTITSIIEIQFEGEPTDFAWVLPLSAPIDPSDVTTAPAGLFDALEELTAPRFVTGLAAAEGDAVAVAGMSSGCAGPLFPWERWGGEGDEFVMPDFSGVEIVGDSVVGPYAIEVITADDPSNLLSWLQFNGYQTPSTAMEPIATYVAAGASFLGVKMNPDVPAGPIDALQITLPGTEPSLPLLLTSVAAVDDMDITAYVLGATRFGPANYVDHAFDWTRVSWTGEGRTDYELQLPAEVDALGGRAFVTEFAGATDALPLVPSPSGKTLADTPTAVEAASDLLRTGAYLSRFRTFISADEMTADPAWAPAPSLGDVSNEHALGANRSATAGVPVWALALLLVGAMRRRRALVVA